MQIKIHRGADQIGGCITEISTSTSKIIIDMGAELPNNDKEPQGVEIHGLTQGEKNYNAVFFTHYHGDHIGLYKTILPEIPLYMGKAAKEIFEKLTKRVDVNCLSLVQKFNTFEVGKKILIGDISITPFLVDHSAYDAYMFLIKADNKTLLHTGDFREHGLRGSKLIAMLEKFVGQVDVLITEGTMLSRDDKHIKSEFEIMHTAKELIKNSNKKYVFVLCSSTNIDRIACFNKANPIGRSFLCDEYQSEVLDVVTKYGAKYSKIYDFSNKKIAGLNIELSLMSRVKD